MFEKIQSAFETLGDVAKRTSYDAYNGVMYGHRDDYEAAKAAAVAKGEVLDEPGYYQVGVPHSLCPTAHGSDASARALGCVTWCAIRTPARWWTGRKSAW